MLTNPRDACRGQSVRYSFLLCNNNVVFKTRRFFNIRLQKCHDLEIYNIIYSPEQAANTQTDRQTDRHTDKPSKQYSCIYTMLKCDKTRKLHNSIITNLGLRKALVVAMLFTAPDLLLIVLSKLVTRRIYVQLICQKHLTRLITTAYILSWWNGMYQLRFLLFLKTGLVVVLRVLNGRTYDLLPSVWTLASDKARCYLHLH